MGWRMMRLGRRVCAAESAWSKPLVLVFDARLWNHPGVDESETNLEDRPVTATFALERRWRDRFLAGGRFGLFVVLFFGLLRLANSPLLQWGKPYQGFVAQTLSGNLKVCVITALITLLLARLERRSFWAFGLGVIRRGRPLVLGLVSGAVALTLLLFLMRCGGVVFSGGPGTTGIPALENGLAYAALSSRSRWQKKRCGAAMRW